MRSDLGLKTWISVRLDGWTNHQRELVRDGKIEDWAAWREVVTECGESSELDEAERPRRGRGRPGPARRRRSQHSRDTPSPRASRRPLRAFGAPRQLIEVPSQFQNSYKQQELIYMYTKGVPDTRIYCLI